MTLGKLLCLLHHKQYCGASVAFPHSSRLHSRTVNNSWY